MRFPPFFMVNYGLEVIVEANGEEVEVVVDALAGEAGADGEVVSVHTVGVDHHPGNLSNVEVEVHGELVGELVVHAGDKTETENRLIVVVLDGADFVAINIGIGGALGAHAEQELTFNKESPVFPVAEIVAGIGGNAELKVAGRHIGVSCSAIVAGVVVATENGGTNLPSVTHLIADFGAYNNGGGGSATDGVVVIVYAIVVETDLATKYELCISCKSESCECKGQ